MKQVFLHVFRWCVTIPISVVAVVFLAVAMACVHVTDAPSDLKRGLHS